MEMYFDSLIHSKIAPTLTLTDRKLDLVSIKAASCEDTNARQ